MYVLMSQNTPVCRFDLDTGEFSVLAEPFMPYNLQLTAESGSMQEKIANINAIHHWCADRVLSLDRRYAKQILNELGLPQSQNDSVKAKISLACRSISDCSQCASSAEYPHSAKSFSLPCQYIPFVLKR